MAGLGVSPARMMLRLLVLTLPVAGCSAAGSTDIPSARPHPSGPATDALGPRYLALLGPAAVISARDAWVAARVDTGNGTVTVMDHWDGARWSLLRSPAFAGWNIDGMAAGSGQDVWAVGYTSHTGHHKVLIGHFDGTAWRRVLAPRLAGYNVLGGVTVVSARDAWAVGSRGVGRRTGGPGDRGTADLALGRVGVVAGGRSWAGQRRAGRRGRLVRARCVGCWQRQRPHPDRALGWDSLAAGAQPEPVPLQRRAERRGGRVPP